MKQWCILVGLLLLHRLATWLGRQIVPDGCRVIPNHHMDFDPALAVQVGVDQAIVYQKIAGWVAHNQRHGRNQRNGRTWTYNSYPEWGKMFPWRNWKTVESYIRQLVRAGLLEKGNLSPRRGDQTNWYTIGANDSDGRRQLQRWPEAKTPVVGSKRSDDSTTESSANSFSRQKDRTPTAAPARVKKIAHQGVVAGPPAPVDREKDLPEKQPERAEARERQDEHDTGFQQESRGEVWETPPPLPRAPSPAPQGHPSTAEKAWEMAYSQLEIQMDRHTFDTYIRGCRFVSASGGVFEIGVSNPYARDMLATRLYRDIRRIVSDIRGERVELRFVVVEKTASGEEEATPLFRMLARQARAEAETAKPLEETMREFGFRLATDEIQALKERYGEARLRQEMEYARRGHFRNPAGFVLYQLGRDEATNEQRADGKPSVRSNRIA